MPITTSILPGFQLFKSFLLFFLRAKPAEHFDPHRKRRETAAKVSQMLKRQHGGGRQHGDLLSIRDRLERRAHGDFRLAVADVAAQQAIHRQRGFHVALHVFDGALLVRGFLKFEGILELALPVGVGRKRVARRGLALGVEREELFRHIVDGFAHARLARFPDGGAQPVELGSTPPSD